MTSVHYTTERQLRQQTIEKIGDGNVIKIAIVDKGHINGPEIHSLSDTGIITIYNQRTGKLITKLIARPGQIRRYYTEDETPPESVMKLAVEHQKLKLNYC